MTTVDSWPKTLPMLSARSWNSTTKTHLLLTYILITVLMSLQRGYQYQLAIVAHSKSNNSIRATKRGINIIISIQEQDLMRHIRQHNLEIYMIISGQIINCCISLQLATDSNMTPNSSNWIRLTWKKRSTPFSRLGSINSNKQRNPYKLHYPLTALIESDWQEIALLCGLL